MGARGSETDMDTLFGVGRSLLLGTLGPDDLDDLLGRSRMVRASRGSRLVPGPDTVVLALLEGAALARSYTPEGDIVVTALLGPGATWGLQVALGRPGPTTELYTVLDAAAVVIGRTDLRRCVSDHPAVARACLRALAHDLAEQYEEGVRFAHASTFQRVVHRLVELATQWGEPDRSNGRRIRVTIPLTQEDLASWAHASRESTAKALSDLRLAGIIETGRRHVTIVDLPRLLQHHHQGGPDPAVRQVLRAIG